MNKKWIVKKRKKLFRIFIDFFLNLEKKNLLKKKEKPSWDSS